MEWARSGEEKEGDVTHLLNFLETEISRQERSGQYTGLGQGQSHQPGGPQPPHPGGRSSHPGGRSPHPGRSSHPGGRQPAQTGRLHTSLPDARGGQSRTGSTGGQPTAAALHAAAASPGCGICSGHHQPAKCFKLLKHSVEERFSLVKAKWLCFCCLESDHVASKCSKRCDNCKGRHHVVLCTRGVNYGGSDVGPASSGDGSAMGTAQGGEKRGDPPSAGVSLSCSTGGVTLLPVASVLVESPRGPIKANLIFDSGADEFCD